MERDRNNIQVADPREKIEQSAFHMQSFVPRPLCYPPYFISIRRYFLASALSVLSYADGKRKCDSRRAMLIAALFPENLNLARFTTFQLTRMLIYLWK